MARLYETEDLEATVFSEEGNLEDFDFDKISDEKFQTGMEEFPALELTLELTDGRTLEYEVFGVFICGEKEYVALHPKTDTEGIIHLMELTAGEDDEIKLLPIEDDAEMEAATAAFYEHFEQDHLEMTEEIKFDVEDEVIEGEENYDRD